MATLTIRNLPEPVVERLRETAKLHGRSMEQEVRELLTHRYAGRREAVKRIRQRWSTLPRTTAKQAAEWREAGRKE